MRSNLPTRILEKEINIAIRERVVVDLYVVDQPSEQTRGYSIEINPADQEGHGILVERLAQFTVFGRRAIHVDRLHPTCLKHRDNLVPVAVID